MRQITISISSMTRKKTTPKEDIQPYGRPKTYGDCVEAELGTKDTPCPFVGCKNNLYLDVSEDGSINHSHSDISDMPETCALRAVDAHRSGMSTNEIAEVLGVTRQRVHQIEVSALKSIQKSIRCQRALRDQGESLIDPWRRNGLSREP
jgi:predicted DNA-binding protein (UPF0251 family)